MTTLLSSLRRTVGIPAVAWQLLRYAVTFLWALCQPKVVLAAKLLAAESQLATCRTCVERKQDPRPRFHPAFRFLWVVLSKLLDGWEGLAQLMQPATVKKWHTAAYRRFWRRRSQAGRPRIARQIRDLIRRISRENPVWGAERIRDTLLLLGYDVPCEDTVRKYMVKSRKPRKPSSTWLPFLRNHMEVSWAIDFFTVTTLSFRTLFVFLVFDHGRRVVIHLATSYQPTMDWVIQQLREATPFGRQPRYLFRDNDGIYGYGVRAFLRRCSIHDIHIAHESPRPGPDLTDTSMVWMIPESR